MSRAIQFRLPDLVALCPYERSFNPHFAQVAPVSDAWIDSYGVFSGEKHAFFQKSTMGLLGALFFPRADAEAFRVCCDFINVMLVLDDFCDDLDGDAARKTMQKHLTAIRGEHGDESAVSRMSRDFWARFTPRAGPHLQRRFAEKCQEYVLAVSREAELRQKGEVLGVDEYIQLRRANSVTDYCFGMLEYIAGADLPDEVTNNPVLQRMRNAAVDMIYLANDLYSYNMEQAKNQAGNNIITVLMQAKGLTLQAAFDHVGQEWKRLLEGFIADESLLPSWGPMMDNAVRSFMLCVKDGIVGNLYYCFETERYFGKEGKAIMRTLTVTLKGNGSGERIVHPKLVFAPSSNSL